jgi:Bacteriocin-protection, YdeI or OmpD-Associated/Domain of unknown function (DUF1905)
VIITINGHSWKSRVAIMRGRFLFGLSKTNRHAAGVATGDEVEVELDAEPRVVVEPTDFARALDSESVAHAAYARLAHSHKRRHVHAIESAKRPETRTRRSKRAGDAAGAEVARGSRGRAKTQSTKSPRPTSSWSTVHRAR